MIEIEDVSKQFDRILALDGVSAQIEENCIFGLVGTNGAGKSTLLRIISGVLHPDHGQVRIDGYPVWENPRAKGRLCFLADTAYFFANATPRSMGEYYRVSTLDLIRGAMRSCWSGLSWIRNGSSLPFQKE